MIAAFALYRRYPLLFLVLAAAVIVPYRLIFLVASGSGPPATGIALLLALTDWALVTPLVSALHVHAVAEVREGRDPRLGPVARQGLRVLPVVAAASIVSWLGVVLGFAVLIAPGVYLLLRWFVVAQAAAIEREGWLAALRSSSELTDLNFVHIFVFAIYVGLIVFGLPLLVLLGLGGDATDAARFLVGTAVEVVTWSFGALAVALLYYDLRLRREPASASAPAAADLPSPSHSLDPRAYSVRERPKGWYIDPNSPGRMRYWDGGDPPDWSGSTRTPRKLRRDWPTRGEDR
jgi:hypothetical protein